jgi:hypothetical protein
LQVLAGQLLVVIRSGVELGYYGFLGASKQDRH